MKELSTEKELKKSFADIRGTGTKRKIESAQGYWYKLHKCLVRKHHLQTHPETWGTTNWIDAEWKTKTNRELLVECHTIAKEYTVS